MTRFSEALCQELGRDQHILLYCLTRLRSPAPIFSTWRERSSTPIRLTFIGADEGLVSALLWGYPRCFWTVVLEKTLESPLDCKDIQPVHPEGDQPWGFFGRNDAKAETSVLWPPQAKSWLIRKNSDVGRDWGQEEKGTTEDEVAGWHHWLDGREAEWTLGVGDGQGGVVCCDSWGHKQSQRVRHDWVTELNWNIIRAWCQAGCLWEQT